MKDEENKRIVIYVIFIDKIFFIFYIIQLKLNKSVDHKNKSDDKKK